MIMASYGLLERPLGGLLERLGGLLGRLEAVKASWTDRSAMGGPQVFAWRRKKYKPHVIPLILHIILSGLSSRGPLLDRGEAPPLVESVPRPLFGWIGVPRSTSTPPPHSSSRPPGAGENPL